MSKPISTIQKCAWGFAALFLGVYLLDYVPGIMDANGLMFGLFHMTRIVDLGHLGAGSLAVIGALISAKAARIYFWILFTWYLIDVLVYFFGHLGKIPLIKNWTGPGVREQSGSGYTVKAVTRHHGPSERFTANLADLDQSTLNIVTGQGGNFLSPYYMDQWKAWYEGTTFVLPFSAKAVDAARQHRLLLEPGK